MDKVVNEIYRMISLGLLIITCIITVLWINNSRLLSEWYLYTVWIISIIIGAVTYWNVNKYKVSKVIKTILLVVTMFLTILLLGTIIIYFITSSMP